jgi:hypothetical protein
LLSLFNTFVLFARYFHVFLLMISVMYVLD